MEEERTNWEHNNLISELIQGMGLAKQLKQHVNADCPAGTMDVLVHQILSSYEKSLVILKCNRAATSPLPESPISVNESPQSDDFDKDNCKNRFASKKRKMLPRWKNQVKVSSENMLEGTHDDGYSWRKYGQKDIQGAKYPRSYYRCTYRNTYNCWATKQVQRSDEDPTIFEVTYRGAHTCSFTNQTVPPPVSPENKEHKPNQNDNKSNVGQEPQEMLWNLKRGLRVDTECRDNATYAFSFPPASLEFMESDNPSFSSSALDNTSILEILSPTFMTPPTPEQNYYSASCQINNFSSAETSANSSPILDSNFALDSEYLDPNFLFDLPGLF